MFSINKRVILCLGIVFLSLAIVPSFSTENVGNHLDENKQIDDQSINAVRLALLHQIYQRRSLYDPAFGDTWSKYFEQKRNIFDPAFDDWSNTFKRSDE